MKPRIITRSILILSLVSLLTDVASEMLYPVMPLYLKHIGFSVVLIGVLEGVAEATAGLSKGYFGKMSDNQGRRLPFVRWGYALSALSKPMMALFSYPLWIFSARTVDRLGKGIRTGARDAMLSDEATTETKGRVFGFHRSMDTIGAFLGPALALLFLWQYPGQYIWLFYLAFIPGVASICLTILLRDKPSIPGRPVIRTRLADVSRYWCRSTPGYRKLTGALLAFALINSSDVFLLLRMQEAGLSDTATIGAYIFYNLVYALTAYPIGMLADRIGLRPTFVGGLLLFTIVYFGMAVAGESLPWYFMLFFLYGIYAAATEGIAKAWISNVTDKSETAVAIGTYAGFASICTMVASAGTGLLWYRFGPSAALTVPAIAALLIAGYFLIGSFAARGGD